ncbi:hypothetical protein HK102_012627, partial [Quaeritorhiza haematococci]
YSYLLTTQLESQRLWYENQISELTSQTALQLSTLNSQITALQSENDRLTQERTTLLSTHAAELAQATKSKTSQDRKIDKLLDRIESLEREFREEKSMNESLRKNQEVYQRIMKGKDEVIGEKEREIGDLREQVRDLMFYLETVQKVEKSPLKEELREGTLVIEEGKGSGGSGSGRRKGKGKR